MWLYFNIDDSTYFMSDKESKPITGFRTCTMHTKGTSAIDNVKAWNNAVSRHS